MKPKSPYWQPWSGEVMGVTQWWFAFPAPENAGTSIVLRSTVLPRKRERQARKQRLVRLAAGLPAFTDDELSMLDRE